MLVMSYFLWATTGWVAMRVVATNLPMCGCLGRHKVIAHGLFIIFLAFVSVNSVCRGALAHHGPAIAVLSLDVLMALWLTMALPCSFVIVFSMVERAD